MMSSLYIGSSGLKAHGEGMNIVGNNLANVSTVAFKQTMMMYQDMTSQTIMAGSNNITNLAQSGMGVRVGETRKIFTEGSFETGSAPTDIGINGIGFYGVTKNGETQYTRAGNFRFNKEGQLMAPGNWNLLGHEIKNGVESAQLTPIDIDFSSTEKGVNRMPPRATTAITNVSHLGGLENRTDDPANPFFGMAAAWDGTATPPLSTSQYSYKEAIQLFDSQGVRQNAHIYYDLAGQSNGSKALEYIIALDPAEDASGLAGTKSAGLLMAGTMSFNSAGQIQNLTAFSPPASDPSDLNAWTAAPFVDGVPQFKAHFKGAEAQSVAFDVGFKLAGANPVATAASANANPTLIFGGAVGATRAASATTMYGTSLVNVSQRNDGYGEGFLRDMQITSDGTIVGNYSNNQNAELYRIPLFRFTSQDGLEREGGNRFTATKAAGAIEEGKAGTENFGSIQEWSLEASNVDYAREFATMIITQRGFQMNSKVVTTSDQMLQKALEIKR